ncbi:MAG: glycosyltransferase family 9 protein [Archangium sp.]
MKSILVIRYSALGDVVIATSLIEPLRAKYPGVRIEWLTDRPYVGLLEGVADRVISISRKKTETRSEALNDVRGRFDLAIDLQNKLWSMQVARAAAPKRLRFVRRTPMQALASLFGNDVVLNGEHQTSLYARAAEVEVPGAMKVADADPKRAAELLPEDATWVAVAPGAAWETKRWPVERLAQVASALRADGYRIALVGGPMDGALLDVLRPHADVDLSNESLPVLSSCLKRVRLLIGNDSGLVHVASAHGTPTVALFGPTSVKRWAPREPGIAVSLGLNCSPCSNHGTRVCPLGHHDCMQKLGVEQVLSAARDRLSRDRSSPARR